MIPFPLDRKRAVVRSGPDVKRLLRRDDEEFVLVRWPPERQAAPVSTSRPRERAAAAPVAAATAADVPEQLTWIGIELRDENDEPVAGAKYRVQLVDRTTRDGNLDEQGRARIEDIPEGACTVRFPGLED